MMSQHPGRWKEYSELTPTEKTVFFDDNALVVHHSTIKSHFFGAQVPLHLFVNKSIVDVIINEMLFHPDDSNDEITKERALNIFEDVLNPLEANVAVDDDNADVVTYRYRIDLNNLAKFNLIAHYLSVGAFFRMASRIFMMTNERTYLDSIGSTCKVFIDLTDMQAMLDNLGDFILDQIQEVVVEVMAEVVKDLAICSVNLIADVITIVVEQDSLNKVDSEMPPMLPHQLVEQHGRKFAHIVQT
ncbi:hypothetical protein AXG93_4548s1190 [Marchantia polymorpha subsp. ruderalis]|uniref:Uncharacterized protein n=1 Tax=Marchantia polymorpha subsp. ruderalis TaxID=1480154 RepID=A0A176WA30_MARPO|nr:hypothetical protein AXG93_4548s1190 [Marchantia polymorpha subsp. ruderalis]